MIKKKSREPSLGMKTISLYSHEKGMMVKMKKILVISSILIFIMSGCTEETNTAQPQPINYVGSYQDLYITQFAEIVNTGTYRYSTGNVFVRHQVFNNDRARAIELYPNMMYEPDVPDSMQAGYTAEIKLEQVNRSAEQPKVIHSKTINNWKDAKVKMPNEAGKMYRYTIIVKDAEGIVKDTRYDPIYTTFGDYNMAMNISKSSYKVGETITAFLENWGPNHLAYHKYGKLFKKDGENWVEVEVERRDSWEGPAIMPSVRNMDHLRIDKHSEFLRPGHTTSIVLTSFEIGKGEYRYVIESGSKNDIYELEDFFVVE